MGSTVHTSVESKTGGSPPGAPWLGEKPVEQAVPEGYLDIPFRCTRRKILRFESGLALDSHLRRLSRLSGAVDRAVALRLGRLRGRAAYVRLGYARFVDYARERVGLSSRTAQELARLGEALPDLPLLDQRLREGRISWTAAVQVARVAGAEDTARWVSLAESLPVRELRQRVRETLHGSLRNGNSPSDGAMRHGESDRTRTDPIKEFAEETGEDMAGTTAAIEAPHGRDTACDSSAGEDDAREDEVDNRLARLQVSVSGSTAQLWDASLELCELVVGGPLAEGPEYLFAEFQSAAGPNPETRMDSRPWDIPLKSLRPRRKTSPASPCQPASELGRSVPELDPSPEVTWLMALVASDVPDCPFDIDESLRALIASRRVADLDLARLLRNFHSLGLARHLGFDSFSSYVEERLGISAARARFLVRLDRAVTLLDEVRGAVREGTIGSVAALLISRVARSAETEGAWLERAKRRTVVRLRREVEWACREYDRSGRRGDSPLPPGRLPSALDSVAAAITGSLGTATDGAAAWVGAAVGDAAAPAAPGCEMFAPSHGGPSRADGRWEETVLRGEWETSAPVGETTAGSSARSAKDGECEAATPRWDDDPGRIRVEFSLPVTCLGLWSDAKQLIEQRTDSGFVPDETVLREVALAFLRTYLPLWIEELLHGDPVAVRDRFACQFPGCTCRSGSGHHIRFVSQGGPDQLWNLTFLCFTHHLAGVHRGRVRVSGRAPDDLVFEVGIRPDGTALETFVGHERRPCRRVTGPASGQSIAPPASESAPGPRCDTEAARATRAYPRE